MRLNWTKEKKRYILYLIIIAVAGIIGIILTFLVYSDPIQETYSNYEDAYTITVIILIRIIITGLLTALIFYSWISQEHPYLDDLPFLMGIFFMSSTYGKALDLLHNLIHYTATDEEILILLKFRFLLIVSSALPLLYIGFTLIFYIREVPKEKIKKNTMKLLSIITIAEIIAIFSANNLIFIGVLLAIILFPALLMVIIIFFFSYRQKRLTQVHPLILSIGFIVCLFCQILRPILQAILMASGTETSTSTVSDGVLYVFISEVLSIIAFIIIFLGLIIKMKD